MPWYLITNIDKNVFLGGQIEGNDFVRKRKG